MASMKVLSVFPVISVEPVNQGLLPGELSSDDFEQFLKANGCTLPPILDPSNSGFRDRDRDRDSGYSSITSPLDRTTSVDGNALNVTFSGHPTDTSSRLNRSVYEAATLLLKETSKGHAHQLLTEKGVVCAPDQSELRRTLLSKLQKIYNTAAPNLTGVWFKLNRQFESTLDHFSMSFCDIITFFEKAFETTFKSDLITLSTKNPNLLDTHAKKIQDLRVKFPLYDRKFLPTLVGNVDFEYEGPHTLFVTASVLVMSLFHRSANFNVSHEDRPAMSSGDMASEGKGHLRRRSLISPLINPSDLPPDIDLTQALATVPKAMREISPLMVIYRFPSGVKSCVEITLTPDQSRGDRVTGLKSYQNILMQRVMMMGDFTDQDIATMIQAVIQKGTIEECPHAKLMSPPQKQWIYYLTILLFSTECQRNRRSFFYHMVALKGVLAGHLTFHQLLNDPGISYAGQFDLKRNMLHGEFIRLALPKKGNPTFEHLINQLKHCSVLSDLSDDLMRFNNTLLTDKHPYPTSVVEYKAVLISALDTLKGKALPDSVVDMVARVWYARNWVEARCNPDPQGCLPMVQERAVTENLLATMRMGVVPKEYQGGSVKTKPPKRPTELEKKEMWYLGFWHDTHPTLRDQDLSLIKESDLKEIMLEEMRVFYRL